MKVVNPSCVWAGVTPFMHDSRVEQSHLNVVTL